MRAAEQPIDHMCVWMEMMFAVRPTERDDVDGVLKCVRMRVYIDADLCLTTVCLADRCWHCMALMYACAALYETRSAACALAHTHECIEEKKNNSRNYLNSLVSRAFMVDYTTAQCKHMRTFRQPSLYRCMCALSVFWHFA